MRKARILIVDDAVVIRRVLTDALGADPEFEVVGTAPDGKIGLAKIEQLHPDLVILDLEMPELDGRDTLIQIRRTRPGLPVIMFSSLAERGAPATLELLALGASDYATKPAHFASMEAGLQFVRAELVPKIRALCSTLTNRPVAAAAPARTAEKSVCEAGQVDIVAIGASTGGPHALSVLLPVLSAQFPVPLLIVQHMPASFTSHLASRLSAQSGLAVREGSSGETLRRGSAWIAPGDHHMIVERNGINVKIQVHQGAPENSCRPAADVLFRSVAEVFGPRALAVVLTGMGQDGLRGCERIRQTGGQVLVQDQATSVVWGMPGQVAQSGLANQVLPLEHIAPEILRRVRAGREMR